MIRIYKLMSYIMVSPLPSLFEQPSSQLNNFLLTTPQSRVGLLFPLFTYTICMQIIPVHGIAVCGFAITYLLSAHMHCYLQARSRYP